jgi:hypothetical protein
MLRHDSTSESLIARLAFEMSVSPCTQKRSNPAPLPMLSMVMLPAYPSSWKRSAIRSDSGKTVELPAVTMSPVTSKGLTSGKASTWTSLTTSLVTSLTSGVAWTTTVSLNTCGVAVEHADSSRAAIAKLTQTERRILLLREECFD